MDEPKKLDVKEPPPVLKFPTPWDDARPWYERPPWPPTPWDNERPWYDRKF